MTFKEYLLKNEISYDIGYLDCSNKGLTDLDGVHNLSNLEYLCCSDNNITEIPTLPPLLKELSITRNNISSFEPLHNIFILNISYNPITDISPIKDMDNLIQLYAYGLQVKNWIPLRESKVTDLRLFIGIDISLTDIHKVVKNTIIRVNLMSDKVLRNRIFDRKIDQLTSSL